VKAIFGAKLHQGASGDQWLCADGQCLKKQSERSIEKDVRISRDAWSDGEDAREITYDGHLSAKIRLVGQTVAQIFLIYLGVIARNLPITFLFQSRVILCVYYYFFEYRDQQHPSAAPITFPITFCMNGLSAQKLILPSPHLSLQLANFAHSYNVVRLS
jgi:hypothetical protein